MDLWLQVPRRPFAARDRRLLNSAETLSLPHRGGYLPVSLWGDADKALVLLVHGWGGHRAQLGGFVKPLLELGFRVAAFDAPAHGDNEGTHTNGFEIAAALQRVVEELGAPNAIIAHSLGTMAVNIALQQGLQVQRIVFSGALRRLSDAFEPFLKMHGLGDDVRAQVEATMVERFGADVWEITSMDLQLPRFEIPALLFHDKEDATTPYVSSVAIARAWPSASLVTTRGLGHRLILRDPEVIRQAVEFIRDGQPGS
jgi:pimeloyl-ACP methyl ester carboxylesterase